MVGFIPKYVCAEQSNGRFGINLFITQNLNNMSKIVEQQIEKSMLLIEGMKNNIQVLEKHGVKVDVLENMRLQLGELGEANKECEALHVKLSERIKHMNSLLKEAKDSYIAQKMIVKTNYPQEQWICFGVSDKK